MATQANWGKLVAFEAALRKSSLIPFGMFSPGDNLGFIAGTLPSSAVTATVVYAAALVIDVATAEIFRITLTGNVTSTTLNYGGGTTIPDGQLVELRFIQDATGNRTLVFPTNLQLDTGFAIDPRASRASVFNLQWNNATSKWVLSSEPFSVAVA